MKANFHYHCCYWYLVEREFVMEGMKPLFVSVPKGKILQQQERQYTRAHLNLGDNCSQCH